MATPKLNLVVLRCADIDRGAAFYSLLGLEFVQHRHGVGPEHQSAALNGLVLELYPGAKSGDATAGTRIGFAVESVDAALASLEAAGGTIISPAKESPWGRRAVIADPDGHRVELTASPPRANQSTRDVLIQAEDLDAALAYYAGILEMPVICQTETLLGFETGAFCLYVEKGPLYGPVFEVLVDDLEAAKGAVIAAGGRVEAEDDGVPRCYVRDRFGLTYNLAEKKR